MANNIMTNRIYLVLGMMNFPEMMEEGNTQNKKKPFLDRRTITISDQQYIIGPWIGPTELENRDEQFQIFEPVAFTTVFFKNSLEEVKLALREREDDIEWLLDFLSLQVLKNIKLVRLEIVDITPPISIGEEREFMIYPYPVGYQLLAKHRATTSLGNEVICSPPRLIPKNLSHSPKARTALRFFCKGLEAKADVDAYTFYFASIEIVAMDGEHSKAPLRAPGCGHEIRECPECAKPLENRAAIWKTVQNFLVNKVGFSQIMAEKLWKIRQLVHGGNHLDLEATQEVPNLLVHLKAAAVVAIKTKFNIPLEAPPFIRTDNFDILQKHFALFGRKTIKEWDLARICYYWENCFLPINPIK